MGSWWKLLGIEAPERATLTGLDVTFRGLNSPWAVLGLVILFLLGNAVIVLLYLGTRGKLSLTRRLLLAGLRVSAFSLVLTLLFVPVLLLDFQGERSRATWLLLDNSASMTLQDQRLAPDDKLRVAIAEGHLAPDVPLREASSLADLPSQTSQDPSRAHLVRAVLANEQLRLLERLRGSAPLQMALFGQRLRGVTATATVTGLAGYEPSENQSAYLDAIHDLLTRREGDLPAAIVLVTDGRDNASQRQAQEVAKLCNELGVPMHVYGVGSSRIGNLQLKDAILPEVLFHNDVVAVPLRWRCQGFHEGTITLSLRLNGKPVATKTVQAREADDWREVLTFTPRPSDNPEARAELVASIQFNGTEAFLEDNEMKRPVRLVDRKVRVLYVEDAPRWEYKFLLQALLRDRRVEARVVLQQGSLEATQSGAPYLPTFPVTRQDLFSYDLLILGDVAAGSFSPERLQWVREFVREGGGLVVMAGRQHCPATYHDTLLAEVLPVEFVPTTFASDRDRRTEQFQPLLTRTGARSEMLALADVPEESVQIWKDLPGLYWHYPVTKLRPGAVALVQHPTKKAGDQPMPLVATQYYGKGLVLFVGTDETWRWRYNVQDKYFGRFWGQVVYQMGLPHLVGNTKRIQLTLDRNEALLGRPGYVYARVLDADYQPWTAGPLVAALAGANKGDAQEIRFENLPGQPGEFRALLPHDAPGAFTLRVEDPEQATLDYRVNLPPRHEMAIAGMAEEQLRQLATASGGKFYREEDLRTLPDDVQPRTATYVQRAEVLPWHPLTLLLLVALLATEWIVRKLSDVS